MGRQDTPPPVPDPALEKDLPRQLGSRVRDLRTQKGWTQKELSRRLGMDPYRVSRLERGRSSPALGELVRLRTVLGAGIDQLVFGEPAARMQMPPQEVLQRLEQTGSPAEVEVILRLLRLLHLGYVTEKARAAAGAEAPR